MYLKKLWKALNAPKYRYDYSENIAQYEFLKFNRIFDKFGLSPFINVSSPIHDNKKKASHIHIFFYFRYSFNLIKTKF